MNYQCYRCGYTINDKTKMKIHFGRKTICKPIIMNINLDDIKEPILSGKNYKEYFKNKNKSKNDPKESINSINDPKESINCINNTKKIKCKYCNKIYSTKSNLNKHYKCCKDKKQNEEAKETMNELVKLLNNQLREKDDQIKDQLKDFKKELEKRDKQIDELIKKAGINNSNNITQNIQNNIKLLAYKDTDLSILGEKDIINCMQHSNMCVPQLIKMIHLNPKNPENHNIYISNLKNGYIMVYNGENWDTQSREEVIEDMINDKECLIQDKVEDWIENGINYPIIMKKFERYLEKKEKNVVLNKIKEEIMLMLFNNRTLVHPASQNNLIKN